MALCRPARVPACHDIIRAVDVTQTPLLLYSLSCGEEREKKQEEDARALQRSICAYMYVYIYKVESASRVVLNGPTAFPKIESEGRKS